MKRALLLMMVALVGCSNAAVEPSDSSEGAATAEAREQLDAYKGAWKLESDASEVKIFPQDGVTITVVDDAVDPTTKETKGTRLKMGRLDNPDVPAVDRAPFVNVDEGKSCENVSLGSGESVTICHHTVLSNNGATLTHQVKITSYQAYLLPTGWSEATQVLTLSAGKLHYTYEVDGEPSTDVILSR